MQYSHKTRATSHQPWPWPHSPLADERLPLGSQPLSVVAALRSAGGLLRRGSGQLKVGLLVLGLVRGQQCNAPVRTGSRSWTSLTTTARTLSWSFHAPGLGVGGAGGSQRKFLSWRCARCTARSANRCWSCARRWSASCCRRLSRRRLVPLTLLLELRVQLVLDRTPL